MARWIYLHGFASSPASAKARAFQAWGAARGLAIDALDLRVPSFEHLRFSAMKSRVREAIDGAGDRVVLIGSSLGGLTACRVAEEEPRVSAVFAMAPAFRLADRWRARIGDAAWESWRRDGFLEVDDYATKQKGRVDFGFVDELRDLDERPGPWPDVRVPVCVVHGTRDDVVPVDLSRAWAADRPNVALIEVDDTHELTASIPRILLEAQGFFARIGIDAGGS
ncbi:MAG: alpha/beta fold hydrolase [Labilithrix sp.]|nr:alpha/beta fold hydrolase [Labilithrix sp.]